MKYPHSLKNRILSLITAALFLTIPFIASAAGLGSSCSPQTQLVCLPYNIYLDGQLLIGNSITGQVMPATLAAAAGITITNGHGTITIASSVTQGITALTGDITASGPGSAAATLATVNSSPGSYGDAAHVATITVDGKGRTTVAGAVSITPSAIGAVPATGAKTVAGTTTFTSPIIIAENATILPSPQTGSLLQIGNADGTPSRVEADGFAAPTYFSGIRKDGTNASPTTLQSGDEIASLNAWGYNGTAVVGPQGAYREYAAQNWSAGANGTYLSLATTPIGSSTLTEAMRVENDGGVTLPATVTGGDKGHGTVNAAGFYQNGVLLSPANVLSVFNYGATGTWQQLTGGAITLGTNAFHAGNATFTSADIGKIIIIYGAGVNGSPLNTTISGYVDAHDVTLSANASSTTSSSIYNAYLAGYTTSQSGSGSYAAGDTITVATTGGTVASIFTVNTTGLVSATANAAGSGGTNGSCVLTGTTGSGAQKFQINATISGGAISAIGSVVTQGSYTTNPTSLNAEPVTSSCSLSGATLTVKMGVGNIAVTQGGVYTSFPSSPVAQASTSGSGTGATINVNAQVSGNFEYGFDDTTAIQSAISATPQYATLYFPCGLYRISSALSVSTSINIKGCGASPVVTLFSVGGNTDTLDKAPFVSGVSILQTAAATDILDITTSSAAVNLDDFSLRFADPIRFVNTGHCVSSIPSDSHGGLPGNGLMWGHWNNLQCFGVDGNHYAWNTVNMIYYTLNALRSYGGGGLNKQTNSTTINYGNTIISDYFHDLIEFGTAYGIRFQGNNSGSYGLENLDTLIRPQVLVENYNSTTGVFKETIPPNSTTQYAFNDALNSGDISIISPDFEPTNAALVERSQNNGFTTPDGYMGTLNSGYYKVLSGFSVGGTRDLNNEGVFEGASRSPTLTAQSALGGSPPSIVIGQRGDFGGTITFGSGTSPTSGQLIQIAYGSYRGGAPVITLSPTNAAAQALGLYPCGKSGSGFYICAANAPSASQANTTYSVDWSMRIDY
jgi:hypothetical protein